jgi:hypothetical protein
VNPLVVTLIQGLIMYGPAWYTAAVEALHKTNPTKQDLLDLLTGIEQKTYDDYIAAARAAQTPTA